MRVKPPRPSGMRSNIFQSDAQGTLPDCRRCSASDKSSRLWMLTLGFRRIDMDKKIAGLLGAVAALTSMTAANAAAPTPTETLQATSYADLLNPVPNAIV